MNLLVNNYFAEQKLVETLSLNGFLVLLAMIISMQYGGQL